MMRRQVLVKIGLNLISEFPIKISTVEDGVSYSSLPSVLLINWLKMKPMFMSLFEIPYR